MKVVRGNEIQSKIDPPATVRVFMVPEAGAPTITVTEVDLAAGCATADHSHDSDQIVYILGGEARFVSGQEEQLLAAGDLIFVPAGTVHRHECVGAETLRQLSVFVPPSED